MPEKANASPGEVVLQVEIMRLKTRLGDAEAKIARLQQEMQTIWRRIADKD